jgi:hypothetical protein
MMGAARPDKACYDLQVTDGDEVDVLEEYELSD